MNLSTHYLGLPIHSPLVASASPLSSSLTGIRRLEDAGAGAVVLHSLFKEQIVQEQLALHHHTTHHADSHVEASSYFPEIDSYKTNTVTYLELIRRAKESVGIPIIASLNGTTAGSWVRFAREMQEAGADALELNLYSVQANIGISGEQVEAADLEIVRLVCEAVHIPVAVKISPFFSNIANMALRFTYAGARGLVMFNRFYQPDIDLEAMSVRPNVVLSTSEAIRLPLRWVALLYGRVDADFAATSGVHTGTDVAKLLLAGAKVTMMASALLRNGPGHIRTVESELRRWMEENEYNSVEQMRGALSQINCEDPEAYERAQYMRALMSYSQLV